MEKKREITEHALQSFSYPIDDASYNNQKDFMVASKSFWHNGVHFETNKPIKAITNGEVVAYRFPEYLETLETDIPDEIEKDNLDLFDINEDEIETLLRYYSDEGEKYVLQPGAVNDRSDTVELSKIFNKVYSNAFILLRHEIPNVNSIDNKGITFYSLYNHLRPLSDLTISEKCQLFCYSVHFKFNTFSKYCIFNTKKMLSGFGVPEVNGSNIFGEVKYTIDKEFVQWDYNGKKFRGFIDTVFYKWWKGHYEVKNSNKELSQNTYVTQFYHLPVYNNSDINYRNVIYMLTKDDVIEIDSSELSNFITEKQKCVAVKYGSNFSNSGYVYFNDNSKNTISNILAKMNKVSNEQYHTSIIKVRFHLSKGFYKGYIKNKVNELELNFSGNYLQVEGKFLRVESIYEFYNGTYRPYASTELIPCETIVTLCDESNYAHISWILNEEEQNGYIEKQFLSLSESMTKRRNYKFESNDEKFFILGQNNKVLDSDSKILVYDNANLTKRSVLDVLDDKSTEFTILDLGEQLKEITNITDIRKVGIYVSYKKRGQERRGYVYPGIFDIENEEMTLLKNKVFPEWYQSQSEENFKYKQYFEISLQSDLSEGFSEDRESVIIDWDNREIKRNQIIGYGGYAKTYAKDSGIVKVLQKRKMHFEIFTLDNQFMEFNPENNYNSHLKVKKEISVHRKLTTKIPPKAIITIDNEVIGSNSRPNLENVFLKKGEKEVELVSGEKYYEMKIIGKLFNLDANEYILRGEFEGYYDETQPSYWHNQNDKKNVYDAEGKREISIYKEDDKTVKEVLDSNNNKKTVIIYKDYCYFVKTNRGANGLRLPKFFYEKIPQEQTFYVNSEMFNKLYNFKDFYFIHQEYSLSSIDASELYTEPTELEWAEEEEKINNQTLKATSKGEKSKINNVEWRKVKDENGKDIWIKTSDIDTEIETEKAVEEIIYNNWDQFFTEVELTKNYGTYQCKEGQYEELLNQLGIETDGEDINKERLPQKLNEKSEKLKTFFFKNTTEWKKDSKLIEALQKEAETKTEEIENKKEKYAIFNANGKIDAKTPPEYNIRPETEFDKNGEIINNQKENKPEVSFDKCYFFNPIAFINHIDMIATPPDFNPYEKYNKETPVTMFNNPGFMPNGYFSYTQDFNAKVTDTYYHEGVDLAVGADNCGKIGIISGINGNVIVEGDKGNYSYGCFLVIQAKEKYEGKYRYYLLGHLDRAKEHKHEGDPVLPSEIVGYVGNTGHCKSGNYDLLGDAYPDIRASGAGAHLHLQMFLSKLKPDAFYERMNFVKLKNLKKRYPAIEYTNVGVVNPFDYGEKYILDGK